MYIFRRKRSGTESKKYYCEFKDHLDTVRRVALSTDKRASEEMARNLERLVAYRQAKRPLDGMLSDFVTGLADDLRQKLMAWDMLDVLQSMSAVPLLVMERAVSKNGRPAYKVVGGHLAGFQQDLAARGVTPLHIVQSIGRCRDVITQCRFRTLSDIQPGPFNQFLGNLRAKKKSTRTINDHLVIFKSFCNWAVKTGILSANPLAHLSRMNEQADLRRVRRPLGEQEITQLISATAAGVSHHGLSGRERSLIYRLAMETGLRWNEIYSLQRRDFTFGAAPCVTVRAANAKNRHEAVQPMRDALTDDLLAYFTETPALPQAKAFQNMWKDRGAEMLAVDLQAAGIQEANDQGVVDFHSLRHTFGTLLAKAGVPVKVAMDLMRHSDVNLTMKLYSHTLLLDKAKALSQLPPIEGTLPEEMNQRMTGTDGGNSGAEKPLNSGQ